MRETKSSETVRKFLTVNFGNKLTNLKFWQACVLLALMVGLAAYGGEVAINWTFESRIVSVEGAIWQKINSTVSTINTPCSYLIDTLNHSGTIYTYGINYTRKSGPSIFYSTNASYVWKMAHDDLTNGGGIFWKAGTYTLDVELDVTIDSITVWGEGKNTKLQLANGVDDQCIFHVEDCQYTSISKMWLYGNNANVLDTTGRSHAIYIDGGSKGIYHDLFITYARSNGISLTKGSQSWAGCNVFYSIKIYYSNRRGWYCTDSMDNELTQIYVQYSQLEGFRWGGAQKLTLCHSAHSGLNETQYLTSNYYINGGNSILIGCESDTGNGHGYEIKKNGTSLDGCISYRDGQLSNATYAGVRLDAGWCKVDVYVTGNATHMPDYAVEEKAGHDYNDVRARCHYIETPYLQSGAHSKFTIIAENWNPEFTTASWIVSTDGTNYFAQSGDFSTTYKSTNGTYIFEQVYGDLAATPYGSLCVKAGTYSISNTISPASYTYTYGEGVRNTILELSTDTKLISVDEKIGVKFENIRFDANNKTSESVVWLNSSKGCVFRDIFLRDFAGHGFELQGVSGLHSFYNLFENIEIGIGNVASNTGAIFYNGHYATDNVIREVKNSASDKGLVGVKVVGGSGLFIDDFHVDRLKNVVVLESTNWIGGIHFTNSWIDDPTEHGIIVNVTTQNIDGVVFRDIRCVLVPASYDVVRIEIASSKYHSNGEYENFQGSTTTQKYNFHKTGTGLWSNVYFRNNHLASGTSGCYEGIPYYRIKDDLYFPTEHTGVATIDSDTSVTFNHGLGNSTVGSPTIVLCSFNTTACGLYTWTATATQVTVTVENSGDYEVYWLAKIDYSGSW